jgi:hypothetical protein
MTTTSEALRVNGPRSSVNLKASNRSNSEKVMYKLTLFAPLFSLSLPVTVRNGLAALIAFLVAGVAPSAHAEVIVNAVETGGDVVISGGGSLNTGAFASINSDQISGGRIQPNGRVVLGSNFGTGGNAFSTSGSGDPIGLFGAELLLHVPDGYVSGNPLSGSST